MFHQEAIGGPGVHQSDEGLVAHGHAKAHGLDGGHAGERIEGDFDAVVPNIFAVFHLQQENPIHGAFLEMILREFLGTVEAQPFAPMGHLF